LKGSEEKSEHTPQARNSQQETQKERLKLFEKDWPSTGEPSFYGSTSTAVGYALVIRYGSQVAAKVPDFCGHFLGDIAYWNGDYRISQNGIEPTSRKSIHTLRIGYALGTNKPYCMANTARVKTFQYEPFAVYAKLSTTPYRTRRT
jgi:hypothetical protein